LNIASIGCGMSNFTGIVDSSFRKAGEHNLRIMGWWRFNIMRSAFLGQHYSSGKQKITTRMCAHGALDFGEWQDSEDLPPTWRDDPEGRTRADSFLDNGTDHYIHLSRYLLIQNNQIGQSDQSHCAPDCIPGTTKFQTNVTPGDQPLVSDMIVTKNTFISEDGNASSSDIGGVGYYFTCVDNDYSRSPTGCFPSNTPPEHNMLRDPTPIPPPNPPGT